MPVCIGPLLTDREFFLECLDQKIEGLQEAIAFATGGDFAAARHSFAEYIRAHLQYEKFFSIPFEDGENAYMLPGESEQQAADRICTNLLISCGTPHQFGETVDWFHNPTYNGYREWPWQLSRHDEWKTLGRVYRATGDEKYAEAFAKLFGSWVRQAICPPVGTNGCLTICWRTIECGLRMGSSWPYALHAFAKSPAFTDDLLIDWYKSVYEHGVRLQHDHRLEGNWLIMEMNGLFHIGVLYPVFKNSAFWQNYAVDMLHKELDKQVYPDQFQYELTSNYHMVVIRNYQRMARLCYGYGVEFPAYFRERLEKMMLVYVQLMKPDGCAPDINDGNGGPIREFVKFLAPYYPQNETFRWVMSDRREGKAPDYTSYVLPYSGMVAMRTGWGKNDVYGFFESAPFGRGHQHEDKLHFALHAYGKYLLPDAGSFAYDTSEMRSFVISTRGHNTMRVNGMDQNRLATYEWHDEDIEKFSDLTANLTDAFDYAAGIYNEGYGPAQDKSVTHRRSVLFLKKTDYAKPFFVITDRMEAPENADNTYEVQWHVAQESVRMKSAMYIASENLHLFASGEPETAWTQIVCGQTKPQWEGWFSRTHAQKDWTPQPVVKFCVQGACKRLVTVVYPSEDGDCPLAGVKASDDIADTAFTLLLKDGRKIVLDEKIFANR